MKTYTQKIANRVVNFNVYLDATDTDTSTDILRSFTVGEYVVDFRVNGEFELTVCSRSNGYSTATHTERIKKHALVALAGRLQERQAKSLSSMTLRLANVHEDNVQAKLPYIYGTLYYNGDVRCLCKQGIYHVNPNKVIFYSPAPNSKQLYVATYMEETFTYTYVESFVKSKPGTPLLACQVSQDGFGNTIFPTHPNLDALKTVYNLLGTMNDRNVVNTLLCRVWDDVRQYALVWVERTNQTETFPSEGDQLVVYYAGLEMTFSLKNLSTMFVRDLFGLIKSGILQTLPLISRDATSHYPQVRRIEQARFEARVGALQSVNGKVVLNNKIQLRQMDSEELVEATTKIGSPSFTLRLHAQKVIFCAYGQDSQFDYIVLNQTDGVVVFRKNLKNKTVEFFDAVLTAQSNNVWNVSTNFTNHIK